jgi:hypothetical protein
VSIKTFNYNYILKPTLLLYGEEEGFKYPLKKYLNVNLYHGCELITPNEGTCGNSREHECQYVNNKCYDNCEVY